ncbi:MAG: helix-turn-helix domain-containing protein [Oscillospiraceae bacterium]|nr:helix-turn-helix domain-containing protein [Oscillospiraceae bacterium]
MYQPKLEKDIRCPLEYGLSLFGGKWKPRILCVLHTKGWLRYGQIRKEMANITDPVLAASLKEMISEELVIRRQYDEIPPKVEYCLTEKGHSLMPILQSICRWSGQYFNEEPTGDGICHKCNHR